MRVLVWGLLQRNTQGTHFVLRASPIETQKSYGQSCFVRLNDIGFGGVASISWLQLVSVPNVTPSAGDHVSESCRSCSSCVDGRNPAPPKKPSKDDSLTNEQRLGFKVVRNGFRNHPQWRFPASIWADQKRQAAEELGLLREDMQRQDQLWHQARVKEARFSGVAGGQSGCVVF